MPKQPARRKLTRNLTRGNLENLEALLLDVRDLQAALEAGDPTPDLAEIHLLYRAASAALLTVDAIQRGKPRPVELLATGTVTRSATHLLETGH